jgi:hypothetical protein
VRIQTTKGCRRRIGADPCRTPLGRAGGGASVVGPGGISFSGCRVGSRSAPPPALPAQERACSTAALTPSRRTVLVDCTP